MIMQKLREFMYGRYGIDQLSVALVAGGFVFYVLYVFTRSRLLYLISLVLYGIAIFRTLSKNHAKRRAENQKFMTFWYKAKNWWVGLRADFEKEKPISALNVLNADKKSVFRADAEKLKSAARNVPKDL